MSGRAARLGWLAAWAGAAGLGLLALIAAIALLGDLWDVARSAFGATGLLPAGVTIVALIVGVVGLVIAARLGAGSGTAPRVAVVLGFVVLLLVRVAIAAQYDGVRDGEVASYDQLTRGVLDGVCCFADRPMGYPIVLSLAYRLLGVGHPAVELVNILCALGTGALVLLLGRRFLGPPAGAVALYLYAIWPAGALMIVTSLPHTSYELLVVAAAWAVAATRDGWKGSAAAGVLLGVAQYVRPSTPLLVPALLVARLWPGMPWKRAITGAVIPMAALFLLVLTPVMRHNLDVHGDLSISTSSFGGHGLWIGTDERSGGRFSEEASAEVRALPGKDFWEQSDRAGALAMERIKADPVGIALLGLRKQVTLWGTERYGVQYGIRWELAANPGHRASVLPSITSGVFWVLLLAAAALGLALRRHRPDRLLVLTVLLVAAVSALHALFEVRDRYHSYVVPLLLPWAAAGILALLGRMRLVPDTAGEPARSHAPATPATAEAGTRTDATALLPPTSLPTRPGRALPASLVPSYFRHPGPTPASGAPGSQ